MGYNCVPVFYLIVISLAICGISGLHKQCLRAHFWAFGHLAFLHAVPTKLKCASTLPYC